MNGIITYPTEWGILGLDTLKEQPEYVLPQSNQPSFRMLDHFPIPTVVLKSDTSIVYANPAHMELSGFSTSEIIGAKFPYPWWTQSVRKQVEKFGGQEVLRKHRRAVQVSFTNKSGELLITIVTCARVRYKYRTAYYIVNRFDITNLREVEDATLQVQRALGKFVARNDKETMPSSLTARQYQVLQLLAHGYNNAAIADRLNITLKSVECHINAIYQELHISCDPGSHSRVKAALLYFSNWNTTKVEI